MMNYCGGDERKDDPVRGSWYVPKLENGVTWYDTDNVVTAVVLGIGGVEVEDATLKKMIAIILMELDDLFMSVNLVITWGGLYGTEIQTDLSSVLGWMKLVINIGKKV